MATTTKHPTPAKTAPAKSAGAKTTASKTAVAKAPAAKPTAKPAAAKSASRTATAAKTSSTPSNHGNLGNHVNQSSSHGSAQPAHSVQMAAQDSRKGMTTVPTHKINREAEKINEAAEELVQTLRETYQTIVENTASTQERGVKLAQTLVENGIEELKSQAEATRSVIQTLTQPAEKPRGFRETYQSLVDSAVSSQERNVKFAQSVVENGIEEMKSQTESAQALVQALAQQSERQRQALQTLARESVESYVNFLFAPLSFWQKGLDAAQEAAQEAAQR